MYPEFKWLEIPLAAYSELFKSFGEGGKVFGAITDIGGQYGDPCIMTEWGPKNADYPLVKHELNPKIANSERYFIAYWQDVHA